MTGTHSATGDSPDFRGGQMSQAEFRRLYEELCDLQGTRVDRCMLYVFRCAVHCATHPKAGPERRKWWNWKDGRE